MRQGDWFTSLDLKDADFQVPILKAQGHFFAICLYGCGLRIPVPAIQLLSGLAHLLKVGRGSDILTRRGSSALFSPPLSIGRALAVDLSGTCLALKPCISRACRTPAMAVLAETSGVFILTFSDGSGRGSGWYRWNCSCPAKSPIPPLHDAVLSYPAGSFFVVGRGT